MAILNYYVDSDRPDNSGDGLTPATARQSITSITMFRAIPASAGDITYVNCKRDTVAPILINNAINCQAGNGELQYRPYGSGTSLPKLLFAGNHGIGYSLADAQTGKLTINNLDVDGGGYLGSGFFSTRSSVGLNVYDCVISNSGLPIKVAGYGNGKILRNKISNIIAGNGSAIYLGEGIANTYPGASGYEIAYNTITNVNGQDGITLHDGSAAAILPNYIHHNDIESGYENAFDSVNSAYIGTVVTDNIFRGRVAGGDYIVNFGNGTPPSKTRFQRNIVDNSLGYAQACFHVGGSGHEIRSNLFLGGSSISTPKCIVFDTTATSQIVANNLLVAPATALRELCNMNASSSGSFRNNVCVQNGNCYILSDSSSGAWTYVKNCMYGLNLPAFPFYYGADRTMAYWLSTVGTTDLNVAPQLDTNYQPLPSSPLIGAGLHLGYNTDAAGNQFYNPPSIGAYDALRARTART